MDYSKLVAVVDSSSRFDELADRLDKYFEQYVPARGKCDTVGGEIVRAMMRLVYRWWNDGDEVGVGYGNITCNPSDRYLEDALKGVYESRWLLREDDYEDWLCEQLSCVLDRLAELPVLFDVEKFPNGVDSRVYENGYGNRERDEELEAADYEDGDDYEDEDIDE